MASGGSSSRPSSGPRSFDFGSDDVLCSYDDFNHQVPSSAKRSDPSIKDSHESRMGRSLVNVYGQQDEYPKEEIITAVEKCMKKYADNLLRHLEGISGRLSQLEIYCYKLERSIGEFRADIIRDQSETDTKLKSFEKHLQEVHRSIQILRDKQELAETQKELAKLQFQPKESSTTTQPQKSEDATASSSSISEPKRQENIPDIPNTNLALALPHHIPPPAPLPAKAPDHNQPAPAPFNMPRDQYSSDQPLPYYPQQSQPLQSELHYGQLRPQRTGSQQQAPVVNQVPPTQAQPFPQYQQQQQWSQPSPQQFTQQQPPSQAQLVRPITPPAYPSSYTHQSPNPETFPYSSHPPPSGGNRTEVPVPFSYGGGPGNSNSVNVPNTPPQYHQPNSSQTSFGPPPAKGGGYGPVAPYPPQSNNVQGGGYNYNIDGARVHQSYQAGGYSYPPPNNVSSIQNQLVMRSHPYGDMIEKAVGMGYPRDQVVVVINRMAESGQPVDFNALLDNLNSRPPSGGPGRSWSG